MKLLNEAVVRMKVRLTGIEDEAKTLLSELGTLEIRLERAYDAASVDALVYYFNMERKRMLAEEERDKTSRNLAGFPALGILALVSLTRHQRPDWDTLVPAAFPEESFGDVRVAVSEDNVELINVSKMARERHMSIAEVVAYLERKGRRLSGWPEFEAKAQQSRLAALKGRLIFPEKEGPAKLQVVPRVRLIRESANAA